MADYLSLRPVRIITPVVEYTRHRFLYDEGVGRVLDHRQVVLAWAAGTVEMTAEQVWTFTPDDGEPWTISRAGGCNCRKPQVLVRSDV